MKQLFLLNAIFLLSFCALSAQQIDEEYLKLDSFYRYNFYPETNYELEQSYTFSYDEQDRVVLQEGATLRIIAVYTGVGNNNVSTRQILNEASGEWENIRRTEYTYDDDDNFIGRKIQVMNDMGEWENNQNLTYVRNAAGLDSIYTIAFWQDNQWDTTLQRIRSYNEQLKIAVEAIYQPDWDSGEFLLARSTSFSYNTDGQVLEAYISIPNDDGDLAPVFKREYVYNQDGLLSTLTGYNYEDGEYVYASLESHTYMPEENWNKKEDFDREGDEWILEEETHYYLHSDWLVEPLDSIVYYDVDAGELTITKTEYYTEELLEDDYFHTTYTRSELYEGEEVTELVLTEEEKKWYFDVRLVATEEITVSPNVALFPNPIIVDQPLSITSPAGIEGEVHVYCVDMNGRVVASSASSDLNSIQLNAPKQAGLYAVSILVDGVLFKTVKLMVTE